MRPITDVLKLMKEKGFSEKQMQEATKQFMKTAASEHSAPEDTASPAAKKVTKYMSDVFTGDVAKKGLARMSEDLDNFTKNPEIGMRYINGAGIGWLSKVVPKNGFKVELGGDTRYFDLDIVDDLAKSGGKYISSIFGSSKTPSLKKHLLGNKLSVGRDKDLPPNVLGYYKDRAKFIGLSKEEARVAKGYTTKNPQYTVAHETQHAINAAQDLPKGASPARVLRTVKENRPEALEGLTDKQLQIKVYNTYKHARGEVDANLTQAYHARIIQELAAGKDPETVKNIIKNLDPVKLLNKSYGKLGFREERIKNWPPLGPKTKE